MQIKSILNHSVQWQYYLKWHLGLNKNVDKLGDYAWYDYVLAVGPLQFRWRGKPWCTHLKRSPEYTAQIKQVLLEDLKTLEINTHSN